MIIFLYLLIAVLIIIILTSKFKINPAISLIIGSIFLGLILKMNFLKIIILISEGIWNSIKGIGLIILFSCIIGQILKESNSIKNFGNLILINLKNKSLLSLNILGLFIGTVVFCDSAFLILNGISKSIASSSSLSLNSLNLSLSGGLYTSHVLIPPTPGPIAAINNFDILDKIGTVMILGIIVSIPSSIISFLFAKRLIGRYNFVDNFKPKNLEKPNNLAYLSIIIPLSLISLNTVANFISKDEMFLLYDFFKIIGNPISALFIGVILSYFIPRDRNYDYKILKNSFYDFLPIILLTSMGSAFGNIIKNSDLTSLLPNIINIDNNSLIYICLISFLCSSIIKTSQGSSTSSIIIVSSILFPIISDFGFDIFELSMIILSIGSGSMMISHINDSYFWIVIKKSKLSLSSGLKYFSLMTIFQSLGTLFFILLLVGIFG